MKKIALCFMTTCLSFTFYPSHLNASETKTTSSTINSKSKESREAKILLLRLNEIDGMDKSNLNSSDKKSLRVEVRSIQNRIKLLDGGVFISVGAIILIVLLLIILL